MYTISLEVNGVKYEGTGDTALEAIENMRQPNKIPAKGLLTFEKEGKKKTQFVTPTQIKRLPMKITRVLLLKQFEFGLK